MIKKFFGVIVSIILIGMSVAILLKASIGIGPYDALSQTVSNVTNIKVGTVTIILNSIFLLVQILLKRKNFKKFQILQVVLIFCLGYIINLFYYEIFTFEVGSYFQGVLLFILGTLISAFGVASVMNINILFTPLEGFLDALSYTFNGDFVKYRWGFDIFAVITSLVLALLFKEEIVIREGTILSLILFSPLMGYFMKLQEKPYKNLGLIDNINDNKL